MSRLNNIKMYGSNRDREYLGYLSGNWFRGLAGIKLWKLILSLTLIFNLSSFVKLLAIGYQVKLFSQSVGQIILFTLITLLILLGVITEIYLMVITWTPGGYSRFSRWSAGILEFLRKFRILNIGVYAILLIIFISGVLWIDFGVFETYIDNYIFRLFFFWTITLVGSVLLHSAGITQKFGPALVSSGLSNIVILKLATYLPSLTTYPFSLDWSETSKYYYGSLFLSEWIYGLDIPYPVLHPTQFILLGLPYLIEDSSIILHRLWQVFLWLSTTFAAAFYLEKRIAIPNRFHRWIFITWTCVFLLMLPVYYQLLIPVILILWGFDKDKPFRSIIVILLASVWAGLSRINWFPYPSLLASTLYFLEQSVESRNMKVYLSRPIVWVIVGTSAAFASHTFYMILSGNPIDYFATSFTSPLLWYRLLPNPTFPSGILPSLFVVVIPQIVLLMVNVGNAQSQRHPIRLISIGMILAVLFAGSLVVSVKIGGGNNLHNFDTFLITTLTVLSYRVFGKFVSKDVMLRKLNLLPRFILAVVLITPILFTLDTSRVNKPPDRNQVNLVISDIQFLVDEVVGEDEKVLFITERQLITFNDIERASIEHEYEKIMLMEMAMANNSSYLDEFKGNIREQQYGLIISDPLRLSYQGSASSFGEENDVWVTHIASPILCYYKPIMTYDEFRLQVLVPLEPDEVCG